MSSGTRIAPQYRRSRTRPIEQGRDEYADQADRNCDGNRPAGSRRVAGIGNAAIHPKVDWWGRRRPPIRVPHFEERCIESGEKGCEEHQRRGSPAKRSYQGHAHSTEL
jgi:hypothetical protein